MCFECVFIKYLSYSLFQRGGLFHTSIARFTELNERSNDLKLTVCKLLFFKVSSAQARTPYIKSAGMCPWEFLRPPVT